MNSRDRRMHADYEEVRETFAGHPHIAVVASGERRPPDGYRVSFQLTGLAPGAQGPVRRGQHEVEISLPREYPSVPPRCVPRTPIFHPNVKGYYCLTDHWSAAISLTDVITKLGLMIQWQDVNLKSILDPVAGRWACSQRSGTYPVGDVSLGVPAVGLSVRGRRTLGAPAAPARGSNLVVIRRR